MSVIRKEQQKIKETRNKKQKTRPKMGNPGPRRPQSCMFYLFLCANTPDLNVSLISSVCQKQVIQSQNNWTFIITVVSTLLHTFIQSVPIKFGFIFSSARLKSKELVGPETKKKKSH